MPRTLKEVIPFEYKIVERSKRKGVLLTVEGKLQHAGKKNENGRIYPEKIWDNILQNESVNERIANRGMVGTLGHPSSGATSEEKISHIVTEHYKKPDGEIWGKIEVVDTPSGRIAATLFEADARLGASSRGDGSVTRIEDYDEVQEDFALDTYDLVINPSTSGAYPRICESVDKEKENNDLIASTIIDLAESTDDIDLLLECVRVSSNLGASGIPVSKAVQLKLTEKKIVEKKEIIREENKPSKTENEEMKTDLLESKEVVSFITEQVSSKLGEATKEKDSKIKQLNERMVSVVTERDNLSKRLKAAEQLIEGFTFKLGELKKNKNTDEVSSKRLGAAEKIIEASVVKLKEYGITKKRLKAAEELLEASLNKHKEVAVGSYVDRAITKIPESVQPKIKSLLKECTSVAEVRTRLGDIKSLLGVTSKAQQRNRKEPLPPKGSKRLSEKRGKKVTVHPDSVTASLLSKFE